ncbi:hypothetical protein [Paenibacillus sp. PAMC 26794]|uniref:hypothetical protein n=1 Tax=Paenibacillus sp. PAMC 26794 TaxID=1257080 RepID=UPI0002E2FC8F|nr:hypothetical protein [Paenibacillus sp. PAMC 26794]
MEALLKADAIEILEPYIVRIKEAVSIAVMEYFLGNEYALTRHKHSARTAASICHDNIKDQIKMKFEDLPKTRIKERSGLFMLIIEEKIILRFKKFDGNLMSSGIATNQAMAYDLHDTVQLELDGMPANGLLYVGYTLNSLQSNIDGVFITSRYGNVNIWDWEVTNEGEIPTIQPVLFPQPTTTETTTKKRRVRAKDKSISAGDMNAINE